MSPRLEAATEVLAAANARWGRHLRLRYRFPTGAEGVYLVEDDGGRYALRYWVGPADLAAVFAEIHRRLDRLRARSVPVPRVIAAGHVGSAYVELSEWIDGTAPQGSDARLIDGALAILRAMRHAAVGDGADWGRWLLASIDDGARNFFRPSRLRAAGGEGAAILSAAQGLMGRFAPGDLVARDIVHGDFGLGNVLARAGDLVAVVDWSGCRDGSGCFDVTGLWWELADAGAAPSALARVRRELDSWPPAARATCTAHYAARHAASALGTDRQDAVFARAWRELSIADRRSSGVGRPRRRD
jgi:aminoglycoside phosphotransferase (APT) family kinase protein